METAQETRWGLILTLWTAGLLAAAQFGRVALTLEPLGAAYPGWPVAYAVSGVAVMGILFGTVAGGIVARFGPARVTLWALVLSGVAALTQVGFPTFPMLMGLRVAEGAGHLALVVAIPTLMAGLATDRDRPLVMGLWAAFFGVSFALTAVIAARLPMTWLYGLHGAAFLAMAVGLWPVLPRASATERASKVVLDLRAIYTRPRLVAPGLGHGLYAAMFISMMTFLPGVLAAPWLAPVLPLVGVTGSLLAGRVARVLPPSLIVSWGFVAQAGCLLVAMMVTGRAAEWAVILGVLAGGMVAGGGFAAAPWLNRSLEDRALANGVIAQLGNVGTFASVPVFTALGPERMLGSIVGFSLACAGVTAVVYRAARASSR